MDRAELYNEIAARKSKPKDFEPYDGNNGRVNRAVDLYKSGKLKSGETLIDVGGGIGDLGYELRKLGLFKRTLVIDIAAKNLEAARKKGNHVVLADVDRHGFNIDDMCPPFGADPTWSVPSFSLNSASAIDAVAALDFIEHIIDPEKFAAECFHILKPGGEIFINTPNIQFFKHIDELISGKFPHTSGDREVFHGGHLAFFTFLDLCAIFGGAGFTGFEQIKDEENFVQPPEHWIKTQNPRSQADYVTACMRLGNSNLLFKAVKP